MKKLILFIAVTVSFISCDKKDCCDIPDNVSGRYVHVLENCDNSNPEENCSEFIELSGTDQVSILVGGDDIVHEFSYKIKGSILIVEEPLTSSFILPFDFKIIDSNTLERTDNGDLWKK